MKPRIYGIAAVGNYGQLGLDNELPWHDVEDLKWFKELTVNNVVLMGPNTFASLKHPLRGRTVRILERGNAPEDYIRYHAANHPDQILWIAGGEVTYRLFAPYIQRWYISRIDYNGIADAYMPPLWDENPDSEL